MRISTELARFLEGPVMIILGTADAEGRPAIGRAVGARVFVAQQRLELMVAGWQWPETLAHVAATGRLAATFSRPSDYETYQLKGSAGLREADEDDLRLAERYRAEVERVLAEQSLAPGMAAHWLISRDLAVVRLAVEEVYVQTPGPGAGTVVRG
jgi:hypothetical protein